MSSFIIIDEIKTAIDSMNASLTSKINTIDGIVDTINSNVNTIKTETAKNGTASESGTLSQKLSSIISYTKTNNTENLTGTLSQKLSVLVNRRERIITPSSTNLKTITNNLSTGNTTAGSSSSQKTEVTTPTATVAYDGNFRIYLTSTLTVASLASATYQSARASILGEIYVNGSKKTSFDMGNRDGVGSNSAVTKTYDLKLTRGDKIYAKIIVTAIAYEEWVPCQDVWFTTPAANGKITDFSIRGTITELSSTVL